MDPTPIVSYGMPTADPSYIFGLILKFGGLFLVIEVSCSFNAFMGHSSPCLGAAH